MSTDNIRLFDVPNLICPSCDMVMAFASPLGRHSMTTRKGSVIICSQCGAPSIVGDSALEPLTKARFDTLDEKTQNAIRLACNGVKGMIAEGGNQSGN